MNKEINAYNELLKASTEELSKKEPAELLSLKEIAEEHVKKVNKKPEIFIAIFGITTVLFGMASIFSVSFMLNHVFKWYSYQELTNLSIIFGALTILSIAGVVMSLSKTKGILEIIKKVDEAILLKYDLLEGINFLRGSNKEEYNTFVSEIIKDVYNKTSTINYNLITEEKDRKIVTNLIKSLKESPEEIKEKVAEKINIFTKIKNKTKDSNNNNLILGLALGMAVSS